MNFLLPLILGLMVGALANLISPERNLANFAQIELLAVLGGLLGVLMANLILGFHLTGFNWTGLIIAILSSAFLVTGPKFFSPKL